MISVVDRGFFHKINDSLKMKGDTGCAGVNKNDDAIVTVFALSLWLHLPQTQAVMSCVLTGNGAHVRVWLCERLLRMAGDGLTQRLFSINSQ